MKIMIPIFNFGKAGGMRVLSQLANEWTEMGHEVSFLVHEKGSQPYFPTTANIIRINSYGKQVNITRNLKTEEYLNGLKVLIALILGLIRYGNKSDIVLANYSFTAIPVSLMSSNVGKFYYVQAYEPEFYNKSVGIKSEVSRALSKLSYRLGLKTIVNADIYKKYKNLRAKNVIPPGLDLNVYYSKELSETHSEDFVVGCIGRIEEFKGSDDVAEAIKILHDKGYNIKFKVAFNPVKYKNHDLVHPDGDEKLADFYRSLDILVAPGHIQLGAVHYPVIEAMACNVPVITTGYFPANDDNSFIVPVKRPDKIADTIEMIINDYSIAINRAQKAKKYILQFDWKIVSNTFIEIFEDTLLSKNKNEYK